MLNSTDFRRIGETQAIIAHVKDGEINSLSFDKILNIIEFILISVKAIMFRKDGKPKTTLELIMSIMQIVAFIKTLIRMINGDVKPINRVKAKTNEAKVVEAIDKAVKQTKKDA